MLDSLNCCVFPVEATDPVFFFLLFFFLPFFLFLEKRLLANLSDAKAGEAKLQDGISSGCGRDGGSAAISLRLLIGGKIASWRRDSCSGAANFLFPVRQKSSAVRESGW